MNEPKQVNFREITYEVLLDRAKRLSEERGVPFDGLAFYLMEASEYFERKRNVDRLPR